MYFRLRRAALLFLFFLVRQLWHLLAEPREPVFADRCPFKCRVAAVILSLLTKRVTSAALPFHYLLHSSPFPTPFFILHTRPLIIFPPLEFSRCHFFRACQIPNSFISKKMKSAHPEKVIRQRAGPKNVEMSVKNLMTSRQEEVERSGTREEKSYRL